MGVLDFLRNNSDLLDADQQASFIKKLAERSYHEDVTDDIVQYEDEPQKLASHVQSIVDGEHKPVSILEQPITMKNTRTITRGLLSTVDEALIREGKKSGVNIFLDTMSLIPRAIRAVGEGIGEEAAKISLDPAEALPATLSIAGGVAGGVTGNPALAYAGGVAGRTLGRYLLDWHKGRNYGSYEDALDAVGSLVGTNVTAPAGGAIRLALKNAGYDLGKPLALGLSKNIITRSTALRNEAGPTATKVAKVLDESAKIGQALRDDAYAKAKELKLQQKWGDHPVREVLDDPTVDTKTKNQYIDEIMSIEEDKRLAASLNTRKGNTTKKTGLRPVSENKQEALLPTEREGPLLRTLEGRELLRESVYRPAPIVTQTPVHDADKLTFVDTIVQPSVPQSVLTRLAKDPLPLETEAGRRVRFLDYAQTQEAERIGSETWKGAVNKETTDSVEALRTVLGLTPELVNNPLIAKLKKSFGWISSQFDTQVGFRKSGNALLQHMGDVLLHSNETLRIASRSIKDTAAALFDKYALNDTHLLHLAGLESKGEIMAAYDTAKENLTRLAQHKVAAANTKNAERVAEAKAAGININGTVVAPRNINKELEQQVIAAAAQYGYKIHPDEIGDFMHSLNFMDEWRHKVSDPLYGIAHAMNPDPKWLAMYNPTYFLPTSARARMLTDIQFQRSAIEQLMSKADRNTEIGQVQYDRYALALKAAQNKEKVAQTSFNSLERDRQNMYTMLAEKGVKATQTNMGAFLPSKKRMLLFDSNPRAAAQEYIDGFLRKSIYDNSLPKAHETLQKFVDANVLNPTTADATKRAASWAQGVLLDQLELRKHAKLENISNALAGVPLLGNGNFEKTVDFITKTHYMLNIALKPRFYGLNALQNVTGLLPQVDTESYAHGLYKYFFDKDNAFKEARAAGVLEPETFQTEELRRGLFTAADPARQFKKGIFDKVVDKVSALADASENMNRVIAFHAGLHHAETYGLTGSNARMKAMDIVKDAHYLYDVANRPSVSNTPLGGLMTRYTTFSKNYASFLVHQFRTGDTSRIASTVAGLLAVSGSKGIPLYGMVQRELAKLGHDVLPDIPAADQVMGLDIGTGGDLLPQVPTSAKDLLGVFYSEGQRALDTLTTDNAPLGSRIAAAGIGMLGSPIRSAISAAQEYSQGGVTSSPKGDEVKSVRSGRDILLSGLGLKQSPKALQAETYDRLRLALKTENAGYLERAIKQSQEKGVTNSGQIIRRLITKQLQGDQTSALQLLTGIPSRR